jgi:hypothetical protein
LEWRKRNKKGIEPQNKVKEENDVKPVEQSQNKKAGKENDRYARVKSKTAREKKMQCMNAKNTPHVTPQS